jgi:hypothetical protein
MILKFFLTIVLLLLSDHPLLLVFQNVLYYFMFVSL